MSQHRIGSPRPGQRRQPQSALERIDTFLEWNNQRSSAESIDRVRMALFGVVADRPEALGEVKLPE